MAMGDGSWNFVDGIARKISMMEAKRGRKERTEILHSADSGWSQNRK